MPQDTAEAEPLARVVPALFRPAGRARFLLLASRRLDRRTDRDRFGIMLDQPPLRPGVAVDAHGLDLDEVVGTIRAAGGSDDVLVLSEGQLDGRVMDLARTIDELAGGGDASLVLCPSGRAGYHEGESARAASVLRW